MVNSTLTIYKVNEHKIINIPAWEGKMQHTLELEEVIVFGDYLFIVNQTHIAKRYFLNTSILVYSFKYNPCNLPIESIHLTGQYLIVQYCIKQFEVYDLKESVFALLVLRKQLKTIKSAMLT